MSGQARLQRTTLAVDTSTHTKAENEFKGMESFELDIGHSSDQAIEETGISKNQEPTSTLTIPRAQSFSTFTKFRKLPIELRLVIWHFSVEGCAAPRRVPLDLKCVPLLHLFAFSNQTLSIY